MEDALQSLRQIRIAYREALRVGDEEMVETLGDIVETTETWLLDQIPRGKP